MEIKTAFVLLTVPLLARIKAGPVSAPIECKVTPYVRRIGGQLAARLAERHVDYDFEVLVGMEGAEPHCFPGGPAGWFSWAAGRLPTRVREIQACWFQQASQSLIAPMSLGLTHLGSSRLHGQVTRQQRFEIMSSAFMSVSPAHELRLPKMDALLRTLSVIPPSLRDASPTPAETSRRYSPQTRRRRSGGRL